MQSIQRAAIVGVTGFIGKGLPALLAEKGIACTGVSRAGTGSIPGVDQWQKPASLDLSGHDAVINLAGEPIDQRWNAKNRRSFHDSRVGVTAGIVEAIRKLPASERPRMLINASAVGIYGDRVDEILTDGAAPGIGYLADLCRDWEESATVAEELGVRVVRIRTGVVLGREGSAFKKLRLVFKFGIGGKLGNGRQWMPWIHIEDLRAAIVHALISENLSGPLNATAPTPERNRDFTQKLASALHRPAVLPVPGFALKLVLGGFGSALLAGQRALPVALTEDGFKFRFPNLESAFADLI